MRKKMKSAGNLRDKAINGLTKSCHRAYKFHIKGKISSIIDFSFLA